MSSDPAAGAPAAAAPGGPRVDAARNGRISFELLAAIATVGVAANGHLVEAALVALVFLLGRVLHARVRGATTLGAFASSGRVDGQNETLAAHENATLAERALAIFAAWFMPLAISLAAAVLLRTGDVAFALTLVLAASPQALLALPAASRFGARMLAAAASAALLAAVLGGFIGFVAAAVVQQASTLVVAGAVQRSTRRRSQRTA